MKNSLLLIFTVIFSSCTLLSLPIISKDDTKIDITYNYYYLNDSKLLLDVSALIPYEELIFTKDIDSFYSDIVYSVKLRDENNDMLYSDSWSDLIRVQYFEKTTSSKDYISDYTLILDNNMFKDAKNLYIEINDYESLVNFIYRPENKSIEIQKNIDQYMTRYYDISLRTSSKELYQFIKNIKH